MIPKVLRGEHQDPSNLRDIFWNAVANEVLTLIQFSYREKMEGGIGYGGQAWEKLSRYTLKHKQPSAGYKKTDILAETGALFDSLAPGVGGAKSTAFNQVNEFVQGGLLLGTKDPKADDHQHGNPDTNLPARPFVPDDIPFQWESHLETVLQTAMAKVVEEMVANGGIA